MIMSCPPPRALAHRPAQKSLPGRSAGRRTFAVAGQGLDHSSVRAPTFIYPCLPIPGQSPPEGPGWLHQPKRQVAGQNYSRLTYQQNSPSARQRLCPTLFFWACASSLCSSEKRAMRIKLTDPNGFLKSRKSCHAFGMDREYIFLHTIFSLAILLMAVLMAVVIGAG